MKILYINKYFFHKGGSETVFFQERKYFKEIGHIIIDFSMKHTENIPTEYSNYFIDNIDYNTTHTNHLSKIPYIIRTSINFIHNREANRKLRALLVKEKPAIAHLHNIYHQITPSIIRTLKNSGTKILLTLHDYKLVCPVISMINGKNVICDRCKGKDFIFATIYKCEQGKILNSVLLTIESYWNLWRSSYDEVDLFLAPSIFMGNTISQYRINANKIRVLYNGIDISEYQFTKNDKNYALYFGRVTTEKGVETFLKAHQSLSTNFPVKVVGTGPLLPDIRKKYPSVDYTGHKTGNDLKELIKNASFVVVPSEWYENCSMSVLESMAYGKPVIASRIGGIPEQIDDGNTGFLYEPGNSQDLAKKMSLLINNTTLRKLLGKNARKKVEEKYSLEAHCTELEKIYENLIHS